VNILRHFLTALFAWKNNRYYLGERLVGPEAGLDALWKREISSVSPGIEPEFDNSVAHSILIIQTGIPDSLAVVEEAKCWEHYKRLYLILRLSLRKRGQRTLLNEIFLDSCSSGITYFLGDKMKKILDGRGSLLITFVLT
jgi:hypothetical protein